MTLGLGMVVVALTIVSALTNWAVYSAVREASQSAAADLIEHAVDITYTLSSGRGSVTSLDQKCVALASAYHLDQIEVYLCDGRRIAPRSAGQARLPMPDSLALQSACAGEIFSLNDGARGQYQALAPATMAGQQYVVIIAQKSPALGRLATVSNILMISSGLVCVALLVGAFVVAGLYRRPLDRIRVEINAAGLTGEDAEGAVDEMLRAYRLTIAQLEKREGELAELNAQLLGAVDDVGRVNQFLVNSLDSGVVVFDRRGVVVGANDIARSWLQQSGVPTIELGANYREALEHTPGVMRLVHDALFSGRGASTDVEEMTGEGRRILRYSALALKSPNEAPQAVAIVITDQTETARTQKRLELSRQLANFGEMAAGLAHQLRNSIAASMGFGALVKRDVCRKFGESSVPEAVDSLLRELHEEAALVDRFLTFARPLTPVFDRVKPDIFLRGVLAGRYSEKVSASVADGIGEISIDPLLMKQVLVNLIDNALRASAETSAPIEVSVVRAGSFVRFSVSDHGHGIPEDVQGRIFTPFFSTSADGAGLGLPLARKIVELHGGTLDFTSVPGRGSTFVAQTPIRGEVPAARPTLELSPS